MAVRSVLLAGTSLLLFSLFFDLPLTGSLRAHAGKAGQSLFLSSKIEPDKATRAMELGKVIKNNEIPQKNQSVILNDPALYKKWDLMKTSAFNAWQLTTGSREIVVAVIDTGIDTDHKDLKNNLWTNSGETGKDKKGRDKATNNIDDDGNGFIDDVHGWNFVHNNGDLKDNHGHGTHIAGIVGAEGGNSFGVTGVAPKVSLMVIKYFDPSSPGNNLKNTILAIEYAVKMNAHIINYSGGGLEFSDPEYKAIAAAQEKGILFVGAAGNERSNSDLHKYYPADYDLDNIISVTALNPNLRVLSSSNYGVHTVDIAAPGEEIYSTLPGNNFGPMTGTSQATALVSGAAALLMAHDREFNAQTVKKYILRTGDTLSWLKSKTGTSKQLNMYRALTSFDQGVGASGVLAANTSHLESQAFNAPSQDSKSSLKNFGADLMDKIQDEKVP